MDNREPFSDELRDYFPGIFAPLKEAGVSLAGILASEEAPEELARRITGDFEKHGAQLTEVIERLREREAVIPPLFDKAYMHVYSELPNRRFFNETTDEELSRVNAGDSRGATVILMDVDKLHAVNERYGYDTGDNFLKRAAQHIRQQIQGHKDIPDNNVIAHFGGDEFAVLVTNESNEVSGKISKLLEESMEGLTFTAPDGNQIPISMSMGVVHASEGDTFATIMKSANTALRADKDSREDLRDQLATNLQM